MDPGGGASGADVSGWKWSIAGLVAAALLFGVGWWIGHHGATLSDPERRALVAQNDTLKARHAKEVRAIAAQAAAALDSARHLAQQAQQAEAGRVAADATADSLGEVTKSLGAELASATTLVDSFPILIAQRDAVIGERDHAQQQVEDERAIATGWRHSYEQEMATAAKLQDRIAVDSTRIVDLERTVQELSKPAWLAFDLLGLRIQCGAGVGFTTEGKVRPAIACISAL